MKTSLHCTVCNSSFNSRQSWHHHLLQEGHLTLAKRKLRNWDEKEKSSALVVVGKLPVGENDNVIKFLSKDIGTFVTNFVCWEQRPRYGFLQFESRDKVMEVMSSVQNNQFRIDPDQVCFVRAATSYPEDEWRNLFPEGEAAFNQDDVVVLCEQSRNTTTPEVVDLDVPSPPRYPAFPQQMLQVHAVSSRPPTIPASNQNSGHQFPVSNQQFQLPDSNQPSTFPFQPNQSSVNPFLVPQNQPPSMFTLNLQLPFQFRFQYPTPVPTACQATQRFTGSPSRQPAPKPQHPPYRPPKPTKTKKARQPAPPKSKHPPTPAPTSARLPTPTFSSKDPRLQPSISTRAPRLPAQGSISTRTPRLPAQGSISTRTPRLPAPMPKPNVPSISTRLPSPIFASKEARLLSFLSHILKKIQIPDELYNMALEIVKHLQATVAKGPQNEDTILRATIFNTWMLKLQYKRTNKDDKHSDKSVGLSILLYKESNHDSIDISQAELAQIGENLMSTNTLNNKKHLLSYEIISNKISGGTLEYHVKQPINGSPFSFVIHTGQLQIGKVQSRSLIPHLISFDFHCFPVLAVTYYWAQLNSILVGHPENDTSKGELANPGGLHWLLMVFFQLEGLIPSTNEILEYPHKPKLLNGVDIGFSNSGQFAERWRLSRSHKTKPGRGNYAEDVFTLLYKFFLFCGVRLGGQSGRVILNTRDSEILTMKDLLPTAAKAWKATKMSEEELTIVRESLKGNQDRIVILHPFFLHWRYSTSHAEKAFRAMKTTGLRLKAYLDTGEVSGKELNLEGFINLLKV